MDKETMSSYGLILITVLLMSILILLTQPIGDKVFGATKNNVETLLHNSGLLDDPAEQQSFATINFIYKLENTASEMTEFENSVKARINTIQMVEHPQIDGFKPYMIDGSGNYKEAEAKFKISSENQVITIYYLPIEYTVTYHSNGGEIRGEIVRSYRHGTTFSLPADVVKPGYKFVGWYEDSGLGGNRITTVNSDDFGNKIFYAKFAML